MKQPELKFGRVCIVWNKNQPERKGIYVKTNKLSGEIYAIDEYANLGWYEHAKPDLNAPPMNGDEVIGEYISTTGFHVSGEYVGRDRDGKHVISNRNIGLVPCISVRFPHPSKRDKLREYLYEIGIKDFTDPEKIIDKILKIAEDK